MNAEFEKIHEYAAGILGQGGSHGMDHTERVVSLCRIIGKREGADFRILIPAALLHDIARPIEKETGRAHEVEGARMAEEFLLSIGYDASLIPQVAQAIRAHRYTGTEKPAFSEAEILSDADKLDAMGASGIARTFLRAGEHGGGIDDAIAHFHDKLLRLHTTMYTASGRKIAEERHAFLVQFLETLESGMDLLPIDKSPEKSP